MDYITIFYFICFCPLSTIGYEEQVVVEIIFHQVLNYNNLRAVSKKKK